MKILHVIPSVDARSGGTAQGLWQISKILQDAQHTVEVVTLEAADDLPTLEQDIKVHRLGPGRGTFGYCPAMAAWINQHVAQYDLLLLHSIWQFDTLVAARAAERQGVAYGVFPHGMLDPYFARAFPLKHVKKLIYWACFLRHTLRAAAGVLFTCAEEQLLARRSFPGYAARERVVPFGMYRPQLDLHSARQEFLRTYPELQGHRLALFLGRIDPKKAPEILLQAYSSVLASDDHWRLVFAGPVAASYQQALKAQSEATGCADRVVWTGMLKGALKWGALAAAEIFVLPSHQENFGLAVTEALAAGTPVLISNRVNIWREIEACGAGLICEDTAAATAQALTRWQAMTGEQRHNSRLRSAACFDQYFNYAQTAPAMIAALQELLTQTEVIAPAGR